MFELGGEKAVGGDRGPSIFEVAHIGRALIYHRLDGENHARLQAAAGSGGAEVEDLRIFVKSAADAVAAVLAHHRVTLRFHVALNAVTDISQAIAGDGSLEADLHGLAGGGNESHGLFVGLAGDHGNVHIAVIAGLFHGDIDREDVPFAEDALPGDAVHYLVVDGDADASGIGRSAGDFVPFGTGDRSLLADELLGDLIEFERGDTWRYFFHDAGHRFGGDAAAGAYFVDLLVGFQMYHVADFPALNKGN